MKIRALLAAAASVTLSFPAMGQESLQDFPLSAIQNKEIRTAILGTGNVSRITAISTFSAAHSSRGITRLVFCGDISDREDKAPVYTYAGFFSDGGVGAIKVAVKDDRTSPAVLMCEMMRN